ncbi:MAG TPA: type II secretion system F family protein [Methyloceanibacter sp.]|nr:type II secretion system F family protein [Methyloceanibacter sp.]
MVSPELLQLVAMALAGLAAGCGAYVLVTPFVSGERKADRRVANVAQKIRTQRRGASPQSSTMRKQQVQDTIKNIEAKQKAKKRVPLNIRLIRAGLTVKPLTYYLSSALTGIAGGSIVLLTGSSLIVSLLVAFACGFGLPRWVLSRLTKVRQTKFLYEFANSIDIISRGIKSGLSLADCLRIVAKESPEPIRTEFVDLVEQQRIGVPLQSAFERMYERMPLQEVGFFAIVVATQAQTGGNLAEVLTNLSQVLRDRYRLRAKVKAFSTEAKTSAMIIGALPFIVMLLMFLTAPRYISLLWKENLGVVMLIVSGIWMTLGMITMRKMINFDY